MYRPHHAASFNDSRHLFRFDAIEYRKKTVQNSIEGEREIMVKHLIGFSMSLWADDKREAIKRYVSLMGPFARFDVTDVTVTDDNIPAAA